MSTGAWITGGGLLVLAGMVWAIVRGFRSATKAQAQSDKDRQAVENVEERRKVEQKYDARGVDYLRERARRWVRRP